MGFFDKVKQSLEQGVNTVSTKSKEMLDTAKVKLDLDAIKKKRKNALEDIGSAVCSMFANGNLDEAQLREKYQVVIGIDAQIKQKENELEQIQNRG